MDIVERLLDGADDQGRGVVEEAADEIKRLRLDAARYRWLRSPNTGPSAIWELLSDDCHPPVMTLKYGPGLDAAIDAARTATATP